MTERETVQALFLHKRLLMGALNADGVEWLEQRITRLRAVSLVGDGFADIRAYEEAVDFLIEGARELAVGVLTGDLRIGELVTLTQDFYVRRVSESEGRFRTGLDTDRRTKISGRFSISRLLGATAQSETFGHKRLSMLAYVETFALQAPTPSITLRPLFIGWRVIAVDGLPGLVNDRREMWPQEIDQFSRMAEVDAAGKDLELVRSMSEKTVKTAFAEIIGETFVSADGGGALGPLYQPPHLRRAAAQCCVRVQRAC